MAAVRHYCVILCCHKHSETQPKGSTFCRRHWNAFCERHLCNFDSNFIEVCSKGISKPPISQHMLRKRPEEKQVTCHYLMILFTDADTPQTVNDQYNNWTKTKTPGITQFNFIMAGERETNFIEIWMYYMIKQLVLTNRVLVMPYGDRDLGPDGTKALPVDLSSARSIDIHLREILQKKNQPSNIKISLKITHLKFHQNLPETNDDKPLPEIIDTLQWRHISVTSSQLTSHRLVIWTVF